MTTLQKLERIRKLKFEFKELSKKEKRIGKFIMILHNIVTILLLAVLIYLECFYGYQGVAKNVFITCISTIFLIIYYNMFNCAYIMAVNDDEFYVFNNKQQLDVGGIKDFLLLIPIIVISTVLYFIWFRFVPVRIIGNIIYWSIVISSIIFPCFCLKALRDNFDKYNPTMYKLVHEMVELADGAFILNYKCDTRFVYEMIKSAEDDCKHGFERDIKTLYNKAVEWEKTLKEFEESLNELFEMERENDYKDLQKYQETIDLKYEVRKLNDNLKDLKDELDRYK